MQGLVSEIRKIRGAEAAKQGLARARQNALAETGASLPFVGA